MTERHRYPSDLNDDQGELTGPMLADWRRTHAEGREPTTALREVVNAILHVTRTGIAWRYLPHDFPPTPPSTAASGNGSATPPPNWSTTRSATSCGRRRVDAGYNNAVVRHNTKLAIDVEVGSRDTDRKGFVVQPIRRQVKQTFGIMSRYRRLHRDYEELPNRSRSMIHWAMVNSMTTRLTATPNQGGQYLRPKPPAAA